MKWGRAEVGVTGLGEKSEEGSGRGSGAGVVPGFHVSASHLSSTPHAVSRVLGTQFETL